MENGATKAPVHSPPVVCAVAVGMVSRKKTTSSCSQCSGKDKTDIPNGNNYHIKIPFTNFVLFCTVSQLHKT